MQKLRYDINTHAKDCCSISAITSTQNGTRAKLISKLLGQTLVIPHIVLS